MLIPDKIPRKLGNFFAKQGSLTKGKRVWETVQFLKSCSWTWALIPEPILKHLVLIPVLLWQERSILFKLVGELASHLQLLQMKRTPGCPLTSTEVQGMCVPTYTNKHIIHTSSLFLFLCLSLSKQKKNKALKPKRLQVAEGCAPLILPHYTLI